MGPAMQDRSKSSLLFTVMLLAAMLQSQFVGAQTDVTAAGSGTTVGKVTEITDQYLFIATPGQGGYRYWFKWVNKPGALPDKDIQATVSNLKVGDTVQVRWSVDDRKRLESVGSVTITVPPQPGSQPATLTPPATIRADVASQKSATIGQAVNAAIDNLLATANRILELPLFALLAFTALAGLVVMLVLRCLSRKFDWINLGVRRIVLAAIGVLLIVLVVDHKIARLEKQLRELRAKTNNDAMARLDFNPKPDGRQLPLMFDLVQVQQALGTAFGASAVRPLVCNQATDFVQVQIASPMAQAYLAIIDLTNPSLEIKLGTTLGSKTLTSSFARQNDCAVAINGEAGNSPKESSGLGVWRGNMIYHGQAILQEDPRQPRPFLCFDIHNRASFVPAASTDRGITADNYNVIWGRFDAIINGEVQTGDERYRQPRTAMGINQDGTRLYLIVVDGRQPRYSMGFTRAEVGQLLAAFGAYNGMLCDEGGSSCLYLKQFGGIVNSPSDGEERPTYTHFGILLGGKSG